MEKQDMVYTMIARYNDAFEHTGAFMVKCADSHSDFFDESMFKAWESCAGAFAREAIDLCCMANDLNDGYQYRTIDDWFVGRIEDGGHIKLLLPEDTAEEREEPTQAD